MSAHSSELIATWNPFAAMGVTAAFLKENQRGMAAVQQNITYRRELLAGGGYRARALGIPRGARESSEVRS